jgi:Tat protein translocase TatB subunit
MFGLGMGEIVMVLVVALLVLGPTKLPEAAKEIGKAIRQLRKHTRDLQETIDRDEAIGGTVRELKSALRGDDFGDVLHRTRAYETEKPVPQVKPVAEAPADPPPAPAEDVTEEPAPGAGDGAAPGGVKAAERGRIDHG